MAFSAPMMINPLAGNCSLRLTSFMRISVT